MRLYLVQHGDAHPKDVDPDRPLTDQGATDIGRLAAWLARSETHIALILHSGKLRARQTAEILASALTDGGAIEARSGLSPNDSPCDLLDSLGDEDTLVAGHMPFVSRAVSTALGLSPEHPVVAFEPGSLAVLERHDDDWRLIAFVRPREL